MSEPNDLSPLLRDPALGLDLRSLLEGGEAHEPSAAELASLGKKLAGVLPPGTLPPAGGGSGPATGGAAGGAKLAAALGVIALIGAGAYLAGSGPRDEAAPPAPAASASAAPVVSVALEPLAPPPASSSTAEVAPPPPPAPAPPPAEPEGTMLARAHDALLRGAPDKALVIANEHAKAYPHGALAQERDVIAIEALVAAGRKPEAQRRAASFRAVYPGSSHQERIDRLVAGP